MGWTWTSWRMWWCRNHLNPGVTYIVTRWNLIAVRFNNLSRSRLQSQVTTGNSNKCSDALACVVIASLNSGLCSGLCCNSNTTCTCTFVWISNCQLTLKMTSSEFSKCQSFSGLLSPGQSNSIKECGDSLYQLKRITCIIIVTFVVYLLIQ